MSRYKRMRGQVACMIQNGSVTPNQLKVIIEGEVNRVPGASRCYLGMITDRQLCEIVGKEPRKMRYQLPRRDPVLLAAIRANPAVLVGMSPAATAAVYESHAHPAHYGLIDYSRVNPEWSDNRHWYHALMRCGYPALVKQVLLAKIMEHSQLEYFIRYCEDAWKLWSGEEFCVLMASTLRIERAGAVNAAIVASRPGGTIEAHFGLAVAVRVRATAVEKIRWINLDAMRALATCPVETQRTACDFITFGAYISPDSFYAGEGAECTEQAGVGLLINTIVAIDGGEETPEGCALARRIHAYDRERLVAEHCAAIGRNDMAPWILRAMATPRLRSA